VGEGYARVVWWRGDDLAVPHLDLAALIATKQHSVRPKDQEDVRVLWALAERDP